jgi:hypothetical protein
VLVPDAVSRVVFSCRLGEGGVLASIDPDVGLRSDRDGADLVELDPEQGLDHPGGLREAERGTA